MAIPKPNTGQKELRALVVTIILFIAMAASAIGFAFTRISVLLYPLTAFGILALVFLIWYFSLAFKNMRETKEMKKQAEPPKEKGKDGTNPLGGAKA